jgi:DNA-binding beta-propeller fold protein YncE
MTPDNWITKTASAAVLATLVAGTGCESSEAAAGAASDVPQFEVDPFWPQPLPENWILGQVAGMAIDDQDHVWIVHRPETVNPVNAGAAQDPPVAMCCVPAPEVIEFDPDGNVVRAWGNPEAGNDWPTSMHGIHVDHLGHVWLGGNGPNDHFVLKFTRDGEFLMQIGAAGQNQGSHDTENVGGPATLLVDSETNELYVADGYQNRRIVVFDAHTGEYRRHWGGYGETPDDTNPGAYDPEEGPSRTFRTPVHGLKISNDGLVYVTDRPNNRIQVFQKDGAFVREAFVRPETLGPGATWYVGFSPDPEQRWMYVPDGTNNVVWILERETLEVVDHFGRGGRAPGQFDWLHDLVVDSGGNIYTTEVQTGHRVQKFDLVGGP